ncbi:MAG: DUF6262 family protein [Pleurocapsa sp. MO_226.B13]|nr:DUF6262 family protein [Pleurocapsa sp. MO_226.B13]
MANREKQAEVLRRTQAKRKEQKKEQVLKAIAQIRRQNKPLTFRNIATVAGCSISYLYKWDEIKAYIHELQHQKQTTLNPIEAFYVAAHQQIYKAALELHGQDKLTDLLGVSTWLKDHKSLTKAGGTAKLAKLLNQTISATNIDRYIALVLEKYQRRQLITAANEIKNLAYDNATELTSVFNTLEEKIFNLTTNKQDKFKPLPIGDCLASVFHKIEQGSFPAYPTGLDDLDALIGGLIKQDLIIIAARASMGKTWLACHLANHIASVQQKPVVFFSAEMSNEQLTKRFLSMHTGIDSHRLMHNQIYEDEYDVLVAGLTKLAELPIIIDDTPATQLTPSKVRSVLRSIRSEKGELGLVVLDYIQKLGDRACRNRAQTVGKFSGAFKDIAKEFDVPAPSILISEH